MAKILCLNQGSSSLKYALYGGDKRIDGGEASDALSLIEKKKTSFDIVAHRLVFGGQKYQAQKITPQLFKELRSFCAFAPLHLPKELDLVEAIAKKWPQIEQFACFDTAFGHTMPKIAKSFPLSPSFFNEGIMRYGFHGLSYAYITGKLEKEDREKLIIAHLGGGSSLAAVKEGKSIETTMGFSPIGGVMMGSRSGDLDPGLLLYLQREKGLDADGLSDLLNKQSGLLGVSCLSADMHILLESKSERAQFAIDLFCYLIQKAIGALATCLEGVKTLVFTGGIGQNSSLIRQKICQNLSFLGIELDLDQNRENEQIISKGACRIFVLKTDEEQMIAKAAHNLLGGANGAT